MASPPNSSNTVGVSFGDTTSAVMTSDEGDDGSESARIEELRRRVRVLERDVDHKLNQFSSLNLSKYDSVDFQALRQLETESDTHTGKSERLLQESKRVSQSLERELGRLLTRLQQANQSLGEAESFPQSVKMHHKDKCVSLTEAFNKLKTKVQEAGERAELLVARGRGEKEKSVRSAHDALIAEGSVLSRTDELTNKVLSQAEAAREALARQREQIVSNIRGIQTMARDLTQGNRIMDAIDGIKRRSSLVLALVISSCIIFLFLWSQNS